MVNTFLYFLFNAFHGPVVRHYCLYFYYSLQTQFTLQYTILQLSRLISYHALISHNSQQLSNPTPLTRVRCRT